MIEFFKASTLFPAYIGFKFGQTRFKIGCLSQKLARVALRRRSISKSKTSKNDGEKILARK